MGLGNTFIIHLVENKLKNLFYSAVCLMRYHVFCIYMFSWMIDYGWLFFW